jgi:hypothetical protein
MKHQEHILSELRELNSTLAEHFPADPYRVPDGYFASFPEQLLRLLHGDSAQLEDPQLSGLPAELPYTVPADYFRDFPEMMLGLARSVDLSAQNEIEELSPLLSGLRQKNPFTVPEGYFEQSSVSGKFEDARTELASLSPLLAGISQDTPYNVPAGYFDKLTLPNAAPVVKMGNRKLFRYAAAAVITGLIATMSIVFFQKGDNGAVPVDQSQAWIEKSMKKVSTDDIDDFVQLTEEPAVTVQAKNPDLQSLMQDVSDSEIQQFLAETQAADLEDDDLIFN